MVSFGKLVNLIFFQRLADHFRNLESNCFQKIRNVVFNFAFFLSICYLVSLMTGLILRE